MKFARDYLAGCKYRKEIRNEHPDQWGVGTFTKVMEDDSYKKVVWDGMKLVEWAASDSRVPFIRLAFCWRDDHTFKPDLIKFVESEAKRFKPIIEANQNKKWYVSPVHEHRLNESQWLQFTNACKSILGDLVTYVNTPETRKGFVSSNFLNEYHGADKTPRGGKCAFSNDGSNVVDSDIESLKSAYKDSEYFMIWNCQDNGRKKQDDETKRKDRKFYTTATQTNSFEYLATDKGKTNFPKDCIGKSHGDQANYPPSGKDCKPVFLAYLKAKINSSRIELKTRNGRTVATSTPRQSWDDELNHKQNGWRWYFMEWGFEIAEKAKRIQGDAVCDIISNSKKIGTWNPAFRDGHWRS